MRQSFWRVTCARSVLSTVLASLVAGSVLAQEAFVTSPKNQIVAIDFAAGTTDVRVDDKGKKFLGLVVRRATMGNDLRFIVANRTGGGDLRVYSDMTGDGARIAKFKSAVAVALNASGDLFAVNGTGGGKDQVLFVDKVPGCPDQIGGPFPADCLPGGYAEPSFIDDHVKIGGVKIKELADVRVARGDAPGLFARNQLLVLVQKPPMILGYTPDHHGFGDCDGDCDPDVVVSTGLIHGTPEGLEIVGNSILVTLKERRIVRIVAGGTGPEVHDFADLPGKGAKLAVGEVENAIAVFATVSNAGGRALVFDQLGIEIDQQKKGVKVPNGIGTRTSGVVATAAGAGVGVSLDQLDTTFTKVINTGITNSTCQFFDHPRPDCSGDDCRVSLTELGFPHDIEIPHYLRPFPVGGPSGPLQFLICTVDTTADIEDTIQNIHEELDSLGYPVNCEASDDPSNDDPRMAWAPIPGDDPSTVDGDRFIDITVGCGNSHRGRGWNFSYVSPIISNLRCTPEQINDRFAQLVATIDAAGTDITGPCPAPGGDDDTVPQPAFDEASLGDRATEWSIVANGVFGAGGNGLLLGGGDVELEVKNAGFDHHFGTANASDKAKTVIFDSGLVGEGATAIFTPTEEPYLFYFENTNTDSPSSPGLLGKTVFSDGSGDTPPLEMAIYRNNADPRRFALFFDDGFVGSGEPDFDDLIITATGIVELRCNLEAALGDGADAIWFDPSKPCKTSNIDANAVIESMSEVIEVSDSQPAGFTDTMRNTLGEVKARAEAILFQACKLVGGVPAVCPVRP